MKPSISRVRMFAGPNGSGKSTIKSVIAPELMGIYINPDDIEKDICTQQALDLSHYQVKTNSQEIVDFFKNSTLLASAGLLPLIEHVTLEKDRLLFHQSGANAYFAAVISDFIRTKLLEKHASFTFETVMSFPDKIEVLRKAQAQGYRTYLYYIATEDPAINISRVRLRVKEGGHSVPEDKIASRYYDSLKLLMQAVQVSHRAYIFDNSGHEQTWIAEITDGHTLEMKSPHMPTWFKTALWDQFAELVY